MITAPYRFPETLRFKHLKVGGLFLFSPLPGYREPRREYKKISARRYVPVKVRLCGVKVKHDVTGEPILIGTVNAAVTDQVTLYL